VFIEAKDDGDGGGGNNWTNGAISRATLQSDHHHQQNQFFYRPDALPVAQPTVSKYWREILQDDSAVYIPLAYKPAKTKKVTPWLGGGGGRKQERNKAECGRNWYLTNGEDWLADAVGGVGLSLSLAGCARPAPPQRGQGRSSTVLRACKYAQQSQPVSWLHKTINDHTCILTALGQSLDLSH